MFPVMLVGRRGGSRNRRLATGQQSLEECRTGDACGKIQALRFHFSAQIWRLRLTSGRQGFRAQAVRGQRSYTRVTLPEITYCNTA